MRLTIRVILASLNATETAMEEVANACKTVPGCEQYYSQIRAAARIVRDARRSLADVADNMADNGVGD